MINQKPASAGFESPGSAVFLMQRYSQTTLVAKDRAYLPKGQRAPARACPARVAFCFWASWRKNRTTHFMVETEKHFQVDPLETSQTTHF